MYTTIPCAPGYSFANLCPKNNKEKVTPDRTALHQAKKLPPQVANETIPTTAESPDKISKMVMINKENGTMFLSGDFAKWPFNHPKFPFQSVTLSIPDCKKTIANMTKINISAKFSISICTI